MRHLTKLVINKVAEQVAIKVAERAKGKPLSEAIRIGSISAAILKVSMTQVLLDNRNIEELDRFVSKCSEDLFIKILKELQ